MKFEYETQQYKKTVSKCVLKGFQIFGSVSSPVPRPVYIGQVSRSGVSWGLLGYTRCPDSLIQACLTLGGAEDIAHVRLCSIFGWSFGPRILLKGNKISI